MKRPILPTVGALLIAAACMGQPLNQGPSTKELMQDKLELSQKLLQGLTMADFPLILSRAERLGALSRAPNWRVMQNPDYEKFSQEFRRNVDGVAEAARNKNLDGATLGYLRVTLNCVECHKFVRGRLVAGATGVGGR